MEEFRLTEGGLFFKTRDAERTVSAAWFLLKVRFYVAIKLDPAWIRFEKWLDEKEDAGTTSGSFWQLLGVVDAFQAVIAFEADKALSKHW